MTVKKNIKLNKNSWIEYYHRWYNDPAKLILDIKKHEDVYDPHQIVLGWYGLDLSHPNSSNAIKNNDWPDYALIIKSKVQDVFGVEFNSCQVNRFLRAVDAINWHSDKKQVSENQSTVAILSLGSYREMLFRPTNGRQPAEFSSTYKALNQDDVSFNLPLVSGDLLAMRGKSQQEFEHALKQSTDTNPRYSLIFRNYTYNV